MRWLCMHGLYIHIKLKKLFEWRHYSAATLIKTRDIQTKKVCLLYNYYAIIMHQNSFDFYPFFNFSHTYKLKLTWLNHETCDRRLYISVREHNILIYIYIYCTGWYHFITHELYIYCIYTYIYTVIYQLLINYRCIFPQYKC